MMGIRKGLAQFPSGLFRYKKLHLSYFHNRSRQLTSTSVPNYACSFQKDSSSNATKRRSLEQFALVDFDQNGTNGNHYQKSQNDSETHYFRGWFYVGVFVAMYELLRKYKIFVVEAAKPFNDPECNTSTYNRSTSVGKSTAGSKVPLSRRKEFNFVADVVESVGNSVVRIEIKDNTMIDWITGKPEVMSNGSGFIIAEDGLILTNAHVVVGRSRMSLTVKLHDGRTFAAYVEDVDVNSDLAIIRIKARGLPTMPLGSSSDTRIGEWVVALGSPLSLTNTVTGGVVSSVSRKASELGINVNDISYIQTDAAITFGNSGGPLVNLDGEAIGINSMKVAAGISFAIPIDYVKGYLAEAEKRKLGGYKSPKLRYIGATLLTLNEDLVRELHASNSISPQISRGVIVWKIVVGSPSYKCGLKPGDIIYKVNGMDVVSTTPIFEALRTSESLKFHVIRRGADSSFVCVVYPEEVPDT